MSALIKNHFVNTPPRGGLAWGDQGLAPEIILEEKDFSLNLTAPLQSPNFGQVPHFAKLRDLPAFRDRSEKQWAKRESPSLSPLAASKARKGPPPSFSGQALQR
jgi:hypothetical protein